MNVLVTGATGFIGGTVVLHVRERAGTRVRAAVRSESGATPDGVERVLVPDRGPDTDWGTSLVGITDIVHLAGRAHVMRESATDPLTEFRRVNVEVTLSLARQAAAAGVRRFVFISSIKVNGETGLVAESDTPRPSDPYAVSKLEAETGLWKLAERSGLEVVVIRPPLVYGPGAGGNFGALKRLIERRIPLPLGSVANRRSLIGLDNLAAFVTTALEHPRAADETFLVSDGEDLSTPALIHRLADAMGRRAVLFPVPPAWLTLAAKTVGRQSVAQRLIGSLQVRSAKANDLLGWQPPLTVDEGLRRAVRAR